MCTMRSMGARHMGHTRPFFFSQRLAHSMQTPPWPHSRNTASLGPSQQIQQRLSCARAPSLSVCAASPAGAPCASPDAGASAAGAAERAPGPVLSRFEHLPSTRSTAVAPRRMGTRRRLKRERADPLSSPPFPPRLEPGEARDPLPPAAPSLPSASPPCSTSSVGRREAKAEVVISRLISTKRSSLASTSAGTDTPCAPAPRLPVPLRERDMDTEANAGAGAEAPTDLSSMPRSSTPVGSGSAAGSEAEGAAAGAVAAAGASSAGVPSPAGGALAAAAGASVAGASAAGASADDGAPSIAAVPGPVP
mmetsp:Transcript_17471/g.58542  ORF Transcript_17471/g.58542 Transcript_17471/m.58542 type:complete len:307 (-) Transcript_17471:1340-2260(-)